MCKDLFETIDTTIRMERLYAEVGLIHSSVEPCAPDCYSQHPRVPCCHLTSKVASISMT